MRLRSLGLQFSRPRAPDVNAVVYGNGLTTRFKVRPRFTSLLLASRHHTWARVRGRLGRVKRLSTCSATANACTGKKACEAACKNGGGEEECDEPGLAAWCDVRDVAAPRSGVRGRHAFVAPCIARYRCVSHKTDVRDDGRRTRGHERRVQGERASDCGDRGPAGSPRRARVSRGAQVERRQADTEEWRHPPSPPSP